MNAVQQLQRSAEAIDEVVRRLAERLGDRLVTSRAVLETHGRGEGLNEVMPPDAVAYVTSNEEVAFALATCHALQVPVIPFGTGTSLEGQIQATQGGISLDLSRMDAILDVSAEDLDCRVQAGVTREALNAFIRDRGLFFPLDPGANATLGGMAATRASGTNAVRYGTMREVTLGLTVVTPDGRIVRTGGRARKSSAGYDLTGLYVGSEGTLGVITELQLRLFGVPERISSGVCQFADLEGAVQAVTLILQMGIPMARIELLDSLQMQACVDFSKLDSFEARPTLFVEFHGSEQAVEEQIATVSSIFSEVGGDALRWATLEEERTALWKARHNVYWAARALRPGCESIATDACVPIGSLAECILAARQEADEAGLLAPIVGHVGDGNFHALILFDPADSNERARAEALGKSIARRAIACGGTATGEHGVGLRKLGLLIEQHGDAVPIMQAIKQALDPRGIMNPGKTIPLPASTS
jgi:D-lactate dehydrogenase (cytochrome)